MKLIHKKEWTTNNLLSILALALLAGIGANSIADTKPPRMIKDPSNSQSYVWDNTSAFTAVPRQLEQKSQTTCSTLNTQKKQYKPMGYHPKAQNINGETFADGGYFCVPK